MNNQSMVLAPKGITCLLKWALPENLHDPILGDLYEEFQLRAGVDTSSAYWWYQKQGLLTAFQFMFKTQKGVFMLFLSVLVFVGVILMAMVMGSSIGAYVNVPSLLIVIPPAICFVLAANPKGAVKRAIGAVTGETSHYQLNELYQAKAVFSLLGNTSMWMGWIGIVIGAVAMASNIEAEEFTQVFGPATAVCLLTLLYSMLIKVCCVVAEHKIQLHIVSIEQ